MKKAEKAFTLTELLVVVVVVAALSAVAIPQYKKVVEARKAGEAEAVLTTIRTEQERRCATGKAYTTIDKLSDFVPSRVTQNFTYSDAGQGLIATSKGSYKYKLKVLTYRDGRICCENEQGSNDCNKFNYPLCSTIANQVTTVTECQNDEECTDCTESVVPSCTPSEKKETASCSAHSSTYTDGGPAVHYIFTKTDCSTSTTEWDLSACFTTKETACSCDLVGKSGGMNATCSYTEYGNGYSEPQDRWQVTDSSRCTTAQTTSCACDRFASGYEGTVQCTYDLDGNGQKTNYKLAGDLTKNCYKTSTFESMHDCSETGFTGGSSYTETKRCTSYYPGTGTPTCETSSNFYDKCYSIGWVFKSKEKGWESACGGASPKTPTKISCGDGANQLQFTRSVVNNLQNHGGGLNHPTSIDVQSCSKEGTTCEYRICVNHEEYEDYMFKCEKTETH